MGQEVAELRKFALCRMGNLLRGPTFESRVCGAWVEIACEHADRQVRSSRAKEHTESDPALASAFSHYRLDMRRHLALNDRVPRPAADMIQTP